MAKCQCKICTDIAKLRIICNKLDKDDSTFLNQMWDQMANAEEDCEYWKLKCQGEWPTDKKHISELLEETEQDITARNCILPNHVVLNSKENALYFETPESKTIEKATIDIIDSYGRKAIYWGYALRKIANKAKDRAKQLQGSQ